MLNAHDYLTYDGTEQSHVKITTVDSLDSKCVVRCNNNVQKYLTQDWLQANEYPFNTVCQNVFNPASRHSITLQSNSKSAQDGGWSNNGVCMQSDSSAVCIFSSRTKMECPCTSNGLTLNQMTPTVGKSACLHTMSNSLIGIMFMIIILLILCIFNILHIKIGYFGS